MSSNRRTIAFLALTAIAASSAWLIYSRKKRLPDESIDAHTSMDINMQQRTALAEAARSKGNKFYTDKKIDEAIACYTESINLYPSEHKDLRLAYANRAACNLLKVLHSRSIFRIDIVE
jgi:import receptor subunit TOM70